MNLLKKLNFHNNFFSLNKTKIQNKTIFSKQKQNFQSKPDHRILGGQALLVQQHRRPSHLRLRQFSLKSEQP